MSLEQGLFLYIVVILSAIIHEYSHGWMAYQQGDPTAKYAGRLTLNPISHMDLFGTVLLPLFLLLTPAHMFFGYAKPVPINPNNFRDQRRGLILVSLAGVGANFLIAVLIGLGIRFLPNFFLGSFFNISIENTVFNPWVVIVIINIWLGLFNLIPVPPLDGSKLLFGVISSRSGQAVEFLRGSGSWLGILVALFIAFYIMPYLAGFIYYLITGPTGASIGI